LGAVPNGALGFLPVLPYHQTRYYNYRICRNNLVNDFNKGDTIKKAIF
jgi:hypothetical protein